MSDPLHDGGVADLEIGQVLAGVHDNAFHLGDITPDMSDIGFKTGNAGFDHGIECAPAAGRLQGRRRVRGLLAGSVRLAISPRYQNSFALDLYNLE
jgi:hypothetical protein